MKRPAKTSRLRDAVDGLDDAKLDQLITALAFNTKLEQATLHHARAVKRRRARMAAKAALTL